VKKGGAKSLWPLVGGVKTYALEPETSVSENGGRDKKEGIDGFDVSAIGYMRY